MSRRRLSGWMTSPEWDVELHEALGALIWDFKIWEAEVSIVQRWRWARGNRRMSKGS